MSASRASGSAAGDGSLDRFAERLRFGLQINIASNVLFGAADVLLASPYLVKLWGLKLASITVSAGALLLLPRLKTIRQATYLAVLVAAVVSAMAAASGLVTASVTANLILCLFLVLATATFLPWGAKPQLAVATLGGIAILANAHGVLGSLGALDPYSVLGVLVALIASVGAAYEFERSRGREKGAVAALRESETTLRGIFTDMEDVYFCSDILGLIRTISPSVRHYGYKPDELIGQDTRVLYAEPTGRDDLRALLLEQGMVTDHDVVFKRKDGSPTTMSASIRVRFAEDGSPVGFEGLLRDVSARKRQEEQMETLLEVANTISGTLDLNAILAEVQPRVAKLLPCDGVVTFYLDPSDSTYRLIGHYGVRPEGVARLTTMRIFRSTVFGDKLLGGDMVMFNDPSEFPPTAKPVLELFEIAALAAAPLFVRGEMLGVLLAFTRPGGSRMLPERVQLFESIARQMAVGIEAVNLYLAQREDAEIFSSLAQAGQDLIAATGTSGLLDRLCEITAHALGCDFSITMMRQEDASFVPVANFGASSKQWETLRVLRVDDAMLGAALSDLAGDGAAHRTIVPEPEVLALHTFSAQFGIAEIYFIALHRGSEIIGIQTAGYHSPHGVFTKHQERVSRGIAQMASLALDNARLIEELERASRVKSDFVASMSHELRTPLGVIMGYQDLLLDGSFGELNDDQVDTLARMRRPCLELLELVNTTLDLSRLEAGRLVAYSQETSATDLAAVLASEASEAWTKPEVEFVCQVRPDLRLHTDPSKLKVALKNLLGNAMKFTAKGKVTFTAVASDGGVEFTVRDTGIGISPAAIEKIFEPFQQADEGISGRFGGSGLGLYTVRRLVTLLGGTVTVDSELGHGSTFRVWVPVGLA